MSAVRDRVRNAPLPGEAEAAARSWPVVEAALAERASAGATSSGNTPRRLAIRLAVVTVLIAIVLAAILSPAGAAVGDWIGDRFGESHQRETPAFAALPPGGSVLAISRTGAYAIHPNGNTQGLGDFSEAGWSPHGEHVVGVSGRRLIAVDPLGTVKWTLVRRGVHHPAWSTRLGFAVAYLQDRALRVVDGTGDPATDRAIRGSAAPVTPAWRPRSDRVLAYITLGGAVEAVDVTTRATLWTAAIPGAPSGLAWSGDGRRLVALAPHSLTVLDRAGQVLRTIPLPGAARDFVLHPSGERAAVVVGGRVLNVPLSGEQPTPLFQGNVDGLAWSADGRHLLLGWRDTGQWLLLGPGNRIRALDDVSRELGSAGGFPRVAGWCCQG